MRVMVSGGSGFIGTRLVEHLLDAGHEVRIYDKAPSERYPELVTLGDVRDAPALTRALAGFDAVYQLAAEHRDDVTPTSLYYDVNVGGARNTVAAAAANGIRRILFTSSVAVYGLGKGTPAESAVPEPFNHYGRSKIDAEQIFAEWATEDSQRSLFIVRPVVVFGEGNRGNVHNLIEQIRLGRFLMVGLGQNRKSMAYVGNVARFLTQALSLSTGTHVFNYADKPDLPIRDVVDLIRRELQLAAVPIHLPYSVGLAGGLVFDAVSRLTGVKFPISSVRIRKFCADTTVSTEKLAQTGFAPECSLEDGLKRMIAAMQRLPDQAPASGTVATPRGPRSTQASSSSATSTPPPTIA